MRSGGRVGGKSLSNERSLSSCRTPFKSYERRATVELTTRLGIRVSLAFVNPLVSLEGNVGRTGLATDVR